MSARRQTLRWFSIGTHGMPKEPGWYLLELEDGAYTIDDHVPGCNWLTMRPVKRWALLARRR